MRMRQAAPLRETEKSEALSFLAQRPLHTVYMASLIRDNGVESPLNRGTSLQLSRLAWQS